MLPSFGLTGSVTTFNTNPLYIFQADQIDGKLYWGRQDAVIKVVFKIVSNRLNVTTMYYKFDCITINNKVNSIS